MFSLISWQLQLFKDKGGTAATVFANPPQHAPFALNRLRYPCNYSCLNFFCMFWSKNNSHLNRYTPLSFTRSRSVSTYSSQKNSKNHWNVNYSVGEKEKSCWISLFFFDNFLKCSAGFTQLSDFSWYLHICWMSVCPIDITRMWLA